MTTVIGNQKQRNEDSGLMIIVGVIGVAVVIGLFFVFVLPAMRATETRHNLITEIVMMQDAAASVGGAVLTE